MKQTIKVIAAQMVMRGEGAPVPDAATIAQMVANLITKNNGDSNKAIETLLSENAQLRSDKRKLKEEKDEVTKKLPQDGTVVLTADEFKLWELYKTLGKPEELEKITKEHTELKEKTESQKKKELIEKAATGAGFKSSVLERLVGDIEIQFQSIPILVDGKAVNQEIPFVKTKDGLKSLKDYASENWSEFTSSLSQDSNNPDQNTVPYHNNGAGGNTPPENDLVAKFIKESSDQRAKGTNPLTQK